MLPRPGKPAPALPGSHTFPMLLQGDHGEGGRDCTASARGKQSLSCQLTPPHHIWLRKHLGMLGEVNAKKLESSFHLGSRDAQPNCDWCRPSRLRVWQTSLSREVFGMSSFRHDANPMRTAPLQYAVTSNSRHG